MDDAQANAQTVDAYIAAFPKAVQSQLRLLRETIRAAAPEAEERISYRMPTFAWHGILVHFAAYEHHIGFYPTPSGIAAFEPELARYPHAKGSVQFPLAEPLPLELVSRIVAFRVAENVAKAAAKSRKRKP